MTELNRVDEVIRALGGNAAVQAITNAKSTSVVSNWKTFGYFPPDTYVALTAALEGKGCTAPAALWRMREPVAQ